uniref:Rab-GAP TBC domain-containing protein n=1 Tax=Tetranychus urticae TaxID=32264 RepID=T1K374_TETUR
MNHLVNLNFPSAFDKSKADPPSLVAAPEEEDSDNDEPLLSGSGEVSKECSEVELQGWADVLAKWRKDLNQRPKGLAELVKRGVPEALRGEVWQLLACCQDDLALMEEYRVLITKETPFELFIRKDTNRTFPANEYFKESGSSGQDSLYRLCKAYSIYDQEIGYCQGLTFITAALLLHMPEEQAFCLLVRIMHQYRVRNLFRSGFEELQLQFYQLERIMEDLIPDLHQHFVASGIEAHMYASQWFLTLFSAKFPLHVVFYILDLFLLQGIETIFQVAIALLQLSRKELLELDFEGVLKHFRVHLPKRYRVEENARILLQTAVGVKIKKLAKYEKEYHATRADRMDPVERLKQENKKLLESNLRLEQENDDLSHDLVNSKLQLGKQLEIAEDKADCLQKELIVTKQLLIDVVDEKKRLEDEIKQVKEVFRKATAKTDIDIKRDAKIIEQYKEICSKLSERLEQEQNTLTEKLNSLQLACKDCEKCCKIIKKCLSGEKDQVSDQDADITEANSGNAEEFTHPLAPLPTPSGQDTTSMESKVRELELELAQTKLALVETKCQNQELIHQLAAAQTEAQQAKNFWFNKTISSIREVAKKDYKDKSKYNSSVPRKGSREFPS